MVALLLPPASVLAQKPGLGDAAGFAACDDLTEDQVRGELNAIAQQIFAQGAPADLTAMVARQWALLDMDRVVDRAVAATHHFKDGQIVEVDGTAGTIRLVA